MRSQMSEQAFVAGRILGMAPTSEPDARKVFVVCGRNSDARRGVFDFLRAIGLRPTEWSEAVRRTGDGSPYIGDVLDAAFAEAVAVVVLLHPDDVAYLRADLTVGPDDDDGQAHGQARPNVLFEAGLAFGSHPKRTILVEHGPVRPFSDVAGRHVVRLDDDVESRKELAQRLTSAGCATELDGNDWLTAGDLAPPIAPGGGLPLGRKKAPEAARTARLDVQYNAGYSGSSGRLSIINIGSVDLHDVEFEMPEDAGNTWVDADLPIKRLPPGKAARFATSRSLGPGSDHIEVTVRARTPDDEPYEEDVFVSMVS